VNYDGAFSTARDGSGWIFAIWLAPLPSATEWLPAWRMGCAPSELAAGVEADAILRAQLGRGAAVKAIDPAFARAAAREADGRPPRLRVPRAEPAAIRAGRRGPHVEVAGESAHRASSGVDPIAFAFWIGRIFAELTGKPAPTPGAYGLGTEPSRPWGDAVEATLRDMARALLAIQVLPAAALEVLGLASMPATIADVKSAFRARALVCHPDRPGGDARAFVALVRARDEVIASLEKNAGGGMTT